MKNIDVIKDLYKDIVTKKNKCKIDLDNYLTEAEIIKRSMEYRKSTEDDSKFFSPRSNDKGMESVDELEKKLDDYEMLAEESREKFEYYENYAKRLAAFIQDDEEKDNDNMKTSFKNKDEDDVTYSLSLNYDINDTISKLSSIGNRLDLCLKIFDNDRERTKTEIIEVKKMIESLIDSL